MEMEKEGACGVLECKGIEVNVNWSALPSKRVHASNVMCIIIGHPLLKLLLSLIVKSYPP